MEKKCFRLLFVSSFSVLLFLHPLSPFPHSVRLCFFHSFSLACFSLSLSWIIIVRSKNQNRIGFAQHKINDFYLAFIGRQCTRRNALTTNSCLHDKAFLLCHRINTSGNPTQSENNFNWKLIAFSIDFYFHSVFLSYSPASATDYISPLWR